MKFTYVQQGNYNQSRNGEKGSIFMELSKMIDHTNLKASSKKEQDILKLIKEAKDYHFASVCVNPTWVELSFTRTQRDRC